MGPVAVFTNPPIGRRLYGIEYRHAADGKDYRHDFGPGARLYAERDGSIRIRRTDGRPVHAAFDIDGKRQQFLINPAGGRRLARDAQKPGGNMARRKRKAGRRRAVATSSRRRKATRSRGAAVVVLGRNKPARARRRAVARGRRRGFRRNPPRGMFRARGLVGMLTEGGLDALTVVGAEGAANMAAGFIPNFAPATATPMTRTLLDFLRHALAAVAVGYLSGRVLSPARARIAMAGALATPVRSVARQVTAGVPLVGSLFAGYPAAGRSMGSYYTRRALPAAGPNGVASGAMSSYYTAGVGAI